MHYTEIQLEMIRVSVIQTHVITLELASICDHGNLKPQCCGGEPREIFFGKNASLGLAFLPYLFQLQVNQVEIKHELVGFLLDSAPSIWHWSL